MQLIEDIVILAWIASMIVGFFHSSANLLGGLLELSLLVWLVLHEIPYILNRNFKTNKFTQDMYIRLGLWLTSFSIFFAFFLFTLSSSDWYFPKLPRVSLPFSISIPIFLTTMFIVFFMSIPYFSWRLRKYPTLANQTVRRLYRSEEEFQKDFVQIKIFGSIKRHITPGVLLSGISVLLSFGLLLLSVVDLLFLAFLLVWLFFNLSSIKGGYDFWKQLDGILIWKGFALEGARISVEGITEVLLLFVALMVVSLMAIPSLIVMVLFGYWYIFLILFQIFMRLRFRLGFSKMNHAKISVSTLPPYADLVTGFYMCVMTISLLSYYLEIQWIFFTAFFLFIPTNIAGVKSILLWRKKRMK